MDLDAVKDEVFSKLQLLDVTQLGQCGVQLNVTVPPNKLQKKTAIRSFLMNHLTSDAVEDHDEVEEIFGQLNTEMTKMLAAGGKKDGGVVVKTDAVAKPEVKVEAESSTMRKTEDTGMTAFGGNGDGNLTGNVNGVGTRIGIEVARFREFKLSNGTFGGEAHVDYPSLCFQIQEGRSLNFSPKEIVSGMIKAMKNPLRKYCEGKQLKGGWTLEKLMNSIRCFANVKEASLLLDEMKESMQEPKEEERCFVTRMMGYRDNILTVTKEEQHPVSDAFVQKKFNRAVICGFRKDTIRITLTPLLRQAALEDDDLMLAVNEAVTWDEENRKKTKNGKDASANSLNVEGDGGKRRKKDEDNTVAVNSLVLKEISKIAEGFTGLQNEFKKLETKVNSIGQDGGSTLRNSYANKRYIKCKSCEERRVFCTHCNKCGKGGHKRRDCTEPDAPAEN